jgi:hypothetical protein
MNKGTKLTAVMTLLLAGGSGIGLAQITGDPITDSWTADGVSSGPALLYQTETSGSYSANIYTTAFTLGAGSSLLGTLGTASGWNLNDTIVGVGGVFNVSSDLTYSGGADQNNVTHARSTSTRIVVKFGTSSPSWVPGSATGASLASGGVGSILLGTYAYDFYPANSGTFITPSDSPEEQTGLNSSDFVSINGEVGQIISYWSGGQMIGFESFMDLTLLDSLYPTANVALGNDFVLDLQRGSGDVQDSLGKLPSGVLAVPEPGTFALAASGLILAFGFKVLRTQPKKA